MVAHLYDQKRLYEVDPQMSQKGCDIDKSH